MPTYEYRCPDGHDFERFYRKFSDATAELACPVCGKAASRVVSGGAGLVFKGSGFYLTDYGKNAHRKGAIETRGKAEGKGSEGASPDAAAKSESGKPEAGAKPTSDAGGESKGVRANEALPDPKKGSGKPGRPPKSDT